MNLLATLDLNDIDTDANHGQMTTIIRYIAPYTVAGKEYFVLSFALGNDVSLRSVLGLPTLLGIGADVNFVKALLSCIEVNRSFPLELQPPGKGLPECASFNHYSPTIPSIAPTNLTHTNSLLYYTSVGGISQPVCLNTPSDNILVTDHFLHDTVIRELLYVPSNSSTIFT